MEYHPMDMRVLRNCKIDLESDKVQEDYRRLRQIHTWIGQIGQLPAPVLYSFAMRHAAFEPAVVKTVEKSPTPEPSTNGKAK